MIEIYKISKNTKSGVYDGYFPVFLVVGLAPARQDERPPEGALRGDPAFIRRRHRCPHRPRPRSLDGLRKNLRLGADGRWRWNRLCCCWMNRWRG